MAESPYHAILLDLEFKDASFIKRWKELSRKHSRTQPWWQIKVDVPESRLKELVEDGQKLLADERYYFQAYRQNELIVVFPEKIFYLTPDKSKWGELLEYGKKLGVPDDQMDIKPVSFEEETY
jgi:hypothetical protein